MTGNRHRQSAVLIMALVVVIFSAAVVDACPSCKAGMSNEHSNLARGYFWSIMFMMSMPFLIFGGLGGYFYLLIRKARLEQATTQEYTHLDNQLVQDVGPAHGPLNGQPQDWPHDPVEA